MEQNDKPFIIAGPCSVESREQLLAVSEALCRMPQVRMIRGGVWKPRTRPGGFEGLGEPALRWMKVISDSPLRMAVGQPVRFCCEVARPEHVALCQQYGIQTIWLGARTTANPFMVEEISEALRGSDMQVMVKNPMSPDVKLWLGAIERLKQVGINHLTAIHRGFSMYRTPRNTTTPTEPSSYRNAPLWEVPLQLRRACPDLPLLCDPSHIGGTSQLIEPLSISAMQLEYDGLMVEVHPHPADALTDGPQQLTPDAFATLITHLADFQKHQPISTDARLIPLRQQIDDIDHELLRLLAQRMELSKQIATVKHERQMTVYQVDRWNAVMDDRLQLASQLHLDADFVKEMLNTIHHQSLKVQLD